MPYLTSEDVTLAIIKGVEIHGEIVGGTIMKPLIEHADPKQLTRMEGGAYDLRAEKFYREHPTDAGSAYIGVKDRTTPRLQAVAPEPLPGTKRPLVYAIPPRTGWWVRTIEWVNMPTNLRADIGPRSTIFRAGAHLMCTSTEPNYQGWLSFLIWNLRDVPLHIEEGARIAKISFATLTGEEPHPYKGVWQGGRVSTEGQNERAF